MAKRTATITVSVTVDIDAYINEYGTAEPVASITATVADDMRETMAVRYHQQTHIYTVN